MSTLKRDKKSLLITNPDLAKEWDYEKNAPLTPQEITHGSNRKVWWRCSNGHSWQAPVGNRTGINRTGCPYCSGRTLIVGSNDLATLYPELAKEWDFEKNAPLTPQNVTRGSKRKVWWRCSRNHSYDAQITNRVWGKGCPYCANYKVLKGYNDLATTNPDLVKEWDYEKNLPLTPDSVIAGSDKKVWWVCSKGHNWKTSICSRKSGNGCPLCGREIGATKRVEGFVQRRSSLAELKPELSREWNYEKNKPLTPYDVTIRSGKAVWWVCSKGHEWKSVICNRTSKGKQGCPYCSNHQVWIGFNDLETINPSLSKEWNPTKNGVLKPSDVTPYSGKKVWWLCDFGHEWQATVANRSNGNGCPICSKSGSSMPEQGIAYYLSQCCKLVQRSKISNKEIDILLTDYNIGIEYDGEYYHRNRTSKDAEKTVALTNSGVRLIRICESDSNHIEGDIIYYRTDNMGPNYEWALRELCKLIYEHSANELFLSLDISIVRDRISIRERFNLVVKENSLATKYPDIANEWNKERNNGLKPEMFYCGSNEQVWWKCSLGHEWRATIAHRTGRKDGCPVCSNNVVLKGFNDLETLNPDLASEWNYDKNANLKNKKKQDISTPDKVTPKSIQKVWWKGKCGHEWAAVIATRTNGIGCPICSNRTSLEGFNDLYSFNPQLAKEWNYSKNGDLKPTDVVSKSARKVWWKCQYGHEWKSTISHRNNGVGCPFCSGRLPIKGKTDLSTSYPQVASEWDYERNAGLTDGDGNDISTPDKVTAKSGKSVWWVCSKGHSWQACICNRSGRRDGCPYCSNQKVLVGFNDVATTNPNLVNEWNNEKNNNLLPTMFTKGSSTKVWWKCGKCGHEWEALISSRSKGHGCPQCALGRHNKKVVNVDTSEIYMSIKDASQATGINASSISMCCTGKLKHAGGFYWEYCD